MLDVVEAAVVLEYILEIVTSLRVVMLGVVCDSLNLLGGCGVVYDSFDSLGGGVNLGDIHTMILHEMSTDLMLRNLDWLDNDIVPSFSWKIIPKLWFTRSLVSEALFQLPLYCGGEL